LESIQKYCLLLFSLIAQLPNEEDVSSEDQTHLSATLK
jgi:hypothetical protein